MHARVMAADKAHGLGADPHMLAEVAASSGRGMRDSGSSHDKGGADQGSSHNDAANRSHDFALLTYVAVDIVSLALASP